MDARALDENQIKGLTTDLAALAAVLQIAMHFHHVVET